MMVDIDNFKRINDEYGHHHGDLALKIVANAISESLKRDTDMMFRWGGEEFLVLLPNTPLEGALYFGERILDNIRNTAIPGANGSPPINTTACIGIASLIPTTENVVSDLIRQADRAMYNAKETGKNKICIWDYCYRKTLVTG
jgi:diguanylate cyclase (GGDEF)-like protein